MKMTTALNKAVSPRLTQRDPGRPKPTTGLENVEKNTLGDVVDPSATFVVFKDQAVHGRDENGVELLQVTQMEREGEEILLKKGWIPKEAFREVDEAYYLPTHVHSTTSSVIGGVSRGLVSAGVPGAVAGVAGAVTSSRVGNSPLARMAVGTLAGATALTAYQAAIHGNIGLGSAVFAGSLVGVVAAAAGDGDAQVRDAMLGGTAAGLAVTMATGLPLGVLTGSAATAVGAKVENRVGQVLLSAGIGAGITAAQALLAGNSVPLAAGLGAAIGGVGSLIGPTLGQAGRNLQKAGEPLVAKGVSKLLEGRGETTYQVAAAVPEALAFGGLGASLGLVAPGLTPVGIALGATAGGLHGYLRAGKRIEELKDLQEKQVAQMGVEGET